MSAFRPYAILMLGACFVIALAACDAGPGQPTPTPPPLPTREVAPRTAVVADGVLALNAPPVRAVFETAGAVTAVHMQPGQEVKQGDLLAQLDEAALLDGLAQARESLMVVEAQAAQNTAPARESDLRIAQANLSSAHARYQELKQGSTASQVEQALRSWNIAKNNLYSAQIARDTACARNLNLPEPLKERARSNVNCTTAEAQVLAAEENVRAAEARYQASLLPVSRDRLAQAYADIAAAQANLDRLRSGPSEAQLRVAEAQLSQARTAVERAARRLSQARLLSPCDCTVQEVGIAAGTTVAPGTTAARLVDLRQLVFRTTNLSERDLGSVQIGAPAVIRLKPFDRAFDGRVRTILPQPASSASAAAGSTAVFTALIDVDPAGEALLPGMTGQAEIAIR